MPDLADGAAAPEPRVTAEQLIATLVRRNGKPSRLKQWGANTIGGAVLALLAGFGTYRAYQEKTDNNEKSIEVIDQKVQQIDDKVGKIETGLEGVQKGQAAIVEGLDSLKQDKLEGLERERDKLERELARERRRRR